MWGIFERGIEKKGNYKEIEGFEKRRGRIWKIGKKLKIK